MKKTVNNTMKRADILIAIVVFTLSFSVSEAATTAAVRCPIQPRIQGGVNHIFFSFYKKESNIGKYIPKNLTLLDPIYTKNGAALCLTTQSYNAFVVMNSALQKDTQQSLVVRSAWRSAKTQQYFANTRTEFAAIPGRSEHQLGTTADINVAGALEDTYFLDSPAYAWMSTHAHEYGFVQSFTKEGTLTTGIPDEPWHWRFVGSTIATKIKTEGLNLDQYLFERKEAKKKVTQ